MGAAFHQQARIVFIMSAEFVVCKLLLGFSESVGIPIAAVSV